MYSLKNSIQNLITNLGTGKDKKNSTKFTTRELKAEDLTSMYSSDWLSGKIIDAPVEDMLRQWITISAPSAKPEDVIAIEKAVEKFKVKTNFEFGLKYGGLYGGELLYMHIGEPTDAELQEPLDVETVSQDSLKFIKLVERINIDKVEIEEDITKPGFGEVKFYTINKKQIHASRCLRFDGFIIPASEATDLWSIPYLQRFYDAIVDAQEFSNIVSSLGHESKKDVIKVQGLMQMLTTADGTEKLIDRFQTADMIKSINNMLILDEKESYSQQQISFGGLDSIMQIKYHIASGASDIPVTRLLGTSATGLSATGEGDINNYYDGLSSKQESRIRPQLEILFEVLIRSTLGSMPEDFTFKFNPLWQPSASQQAEIDLKNATRDQVYLVNQVMLPSMILKNLKNQETYDSISDEYVEAVEAVEGVDDGGGEGSNEL